MAKEKDKKSEIASLEEAREYRASLHREKLSNPSEQERREAFRVFWATERNKYGRTKDLEEILWLHLKATKKDEPTKFEDGLSHFGLKKLG